MKRFSAGLFAAATIGTMVAGSTAASAQITQPGCTSTFPAGDFAAAGYSQIIGGVVGASSAIGSVIGTMNTAFIAQGNAFVAGLPNPKVDETSGGIWGRMIGGRVDNTSNSTFAGTVNEVPTGGTAVTGQINCRSDVRMAYGGFQLGQDIAKLNIGGNGGTVHVGVTGGYAEANAQDQAGSGFTGNFQIPFVGLYAAYTKGAFFADILARADFYQMSLTAPDAALQNQRLNGLGGTISASAGYRINVGNNWFVEPSGSLIYSKVNLDTLNLPGGYGNNNNPFFLPLGTLNMAPIESVLGRVGARVGTTYNAFNITWQPFATASVWHEFAGNTSSSYSAPLYNNFGSVGPTPPAAGIISTSRVGTFGQYSVGVAAQASGSPLLGYVRVDYKEGSQIESLGFNAGLRYNFDPSNGLMYKPAGVFKAIPRPAVYDWTGVYAGAFTGVGFGNSKWSFPQTGTGANSRIAGALGGVDIGYNKQYGQWVLGIEGDAMGTNAKGGQGCIPSFVDITPLDNGLPTANCNSNLNWLATVTGKVGYAWDRVLAYGKAGVAFTDNRLDESCNGDAFFPQGGCIPQNNPAGGVQTLTATFGQVGWTLGAGFELALTPRWSAKAEYNYINFGSKNLIMADTSLVNFKQDFNLVKVGVNYHFGKDDQVAVASAMPLKAKAAPVASYDWNGFYLGAAISDRMSSSTWNTTGIGDGVPGDPLVPPDPTTTPAKFFNADIQGRLFAGYNWQFAPKWVAGIEADAGSPGRTGMTRGGIPGTFGNGVNACDAPGPGSVCNQSPGPGGFGFPGLEAEAVDSVNVKLGWDGTLRAKLGTLITPTILFYGTGGVAFQQVSVNAACDGSADSWCVAPRSQTFSDIRVGWTAGLGLEAVLSGNWIGKVEARYADFGNYKNVFFAGTGDDVATSVRIQTVTALAGVSYKFGPPGAVVAKY